MPPYGGIAVRSRYIKIMKAIGFHRGRSVSGARRLLLAALVCTCAAAPLAGAKAAGTAASVTGSAASQVIEIVVGAQKQIAMGRTLQRVAVGDPRSPMCFGSRAMAARTAVCCWSEKARDARS